MQHAKTTNVHPADLNYDRYTKNQYDRDIINAIPFHKEMHLAIADYLLNHFDRNSTVKIVDLGAGTAITSALIRTILPHAHFDIVDFSRQMISGAKKRMGINNVRYFLEDYALMQFPEKYDIVTTVIGLHHQNILGTKRLIKKIYKGLKPGGIFILGDLMTYKNKHTAALNNALHYHSLVEKAVNTKVLTEWAHHHMFLNDLKPIEDHLTWLHDAGFTIVKKFSKFNTVLLIAKK